VNDDAQDTTEANVPDFAALHTGLLIADREIVIFLWLTSRVIGDTEFFFSLDGKMIYLQLIQHAPWLWPVGMVSSQASMTAAYLHCT
jgi:hypothetical protein